MVRSKRGTLSRQRGNGGDWSEVAVVAKIKSHAVIRFEAAETKRRAVVLTCDPSTDNETVLEVTTQKGKHITLRARSRDARDAWVAFLRRTRAEVTSNPAPPVSTQPTPQPQRQPPVVPPLRLKSRGKGGKSAGVLPFLTPQLSRRSQASSSLAEITPRLPPAYGSQGSPSPSRLRRTYSDETGSSWADGAASSSQSRRRMRPVLLGSAIREWSKEHGDEPIATVSKKWRNSARFGSKETHSHHRHYHPNEPRVARFKTNAMGEIIIKNHPLWVLMHQIQIGIRHCIAGERLSEESVALLRTEGYWRKPEFFATPPILRFPSAGSQDTVKHSMGDFKFKDYCPLTFRYLRAFFGINRADYIVSLCHSTSVGENPLRLMTTPGKSGSLFFFSQDMRYIIKTIPKDEARLLRGILPPYVDHVTKNPNTLLPRFFGLHRVKPHKGNQVRFVVMANLFATSLKIHERFDLKGSVLGRYVTPQERAAKGPNVTLKETNLKELGRYIRVGSERREQMLEQLQADSAMLAKLGIMDYSLLVGVHHTAPPSQETPDTPGPVATVTTAASTVLTPGAGTSTDVPSPYPTHATVAGSSEAPVAPAASPPQPSTSPEFLSMSIDLQPQAAAVTRAGDTDIVTLSQPLELTTDEHEDLKPAPMPPATWFQEDGGMWGRDATGRERLGECYFIGIIDILMFYSVRKAAERLYKTMRFRGQGEVSSCPPDRYAERFVKYLSSVIV